MFLDAFVGSNAPEEAMVWWQLMLGTAEGETVWITLPCWQRKERFVVNLVNLQMTPMVTLYIVNVPVSAVAGNYRSRSGNLVVCPLE